MGTVGTRSSEEALLMRRALDVLGAVLWVVLLVLLASMEGGR